jgi:hypothetical protein
VTKGEQVHERTIAYHAKKKEKPRPVDPTTPEAGENAHEGKDVGVEPHAKEILAMLDQKNRIKAAVALAEIEIEELLLPARVDECRHIPPTLTHDFTKLSEVFKRITSHLFYAGITNSIDFPEVIAYGMTFFALDGVDSPKVSIITVKEGGERKNRTKEN